jgi:flagellar biosynthesis/type III secretory pathway chaperone
MNELIQNLVESLREELKQYGELLALLDVQQEQVVRRLAAELLETVAAISAQGEAIRSARREREQRQRDLSLSLSLPGEALFAQLVPLLPAAYRPLVVALVDENNQLLTRVRQRARQNHLLLRRSLELMEQFLHTLCGAGAPTYNELGTVAAPGSPGRALYEGIC